jgi:hypothetical protein
MTDFTFMLPCIVIDFFLNNQTDALIIQIYSVIKLYTGNLPVPNVQWKTPDDGERRWPKHVEFYNRINLDN